MSNRRKLKSIKESRKKRIIKLSGGKCKKCGYKKTQRALSFHHINPEEKIFCLSKNNLKRPWKLIKKELKKCDLLCLNCHAEVEELIEKKKNFSYEKWISNY
jgi:5-methylcytosine-specific restriction endonuclease McrA